MKLLQGHCLDVLPWACSSCGSTNPIKRAKGLCRKCYETKYRTDRIAREPGWRAKESRERYLQNREQSIERTTQQRRALKREVLSQLGGLCACCGETRIEFLTLDHINNDGAEHRRLLTGKSRASSIKVYRDVRRLGFPRDRFRVLCFNCNCSHGMWGYCPHQREREARDASMTAGLPLGTAEAEAA